MVIRGLDDLLVTHRADGLDDGRNACLGGGVNAVAEREERVRCHDGTAYLETLVSGLDRGDLRRIDATHLAGPDTDRHVVLAEDNGIRLDVLDDGPGRPKPS